ncbi:MAG: type II CAAX endopeptidase family protein [Gemmatimonadota bacterium]
MFYLLILLLLVVLPILAVAQARMMPQGEVAPLPAYYSSLVLLAVLGTLAFIVGRGALGWSGMGLWPLPAFGVLLAWSVGLTGVGVLILFAFRQLMRVMGIEEAPLLRQLLPRSTKEKWVFAVLSLAAGIAEEMSFRGFLIPALMGMSLGAGWALLVSSAAFGMVHAYQGWTGFFRTGILGGFLGFSLLHTGSLWPAMVAHTLIDLLAGLVLPPWLVGEGETLNESI